VAGSLGGGKATDQETAPVIRACWRLGVRLGLYRRIAGLADRREIDRFAAELIDRFGSLPAEIENLLEIIAIKRWCREAGIERLEAGPKGPPSSHCVTTASPTLPVWST
jgi:TRCF domain